MGSCASSEEDEENGKVMKVNGNTYSCVRRLGEGGYSQVFLVAETSITKKLYALKRMNLGSEDLLEQASKEIQIMKQFSHPNIISLVDYESSPNHALLLLPFYSGGTLEEVVTNPMSQLNNQDSIRRVFLGICRGVEQLHRAQLAHRDLKPLNVLLSSSSNFETDNVVLCDLGSVATSRIDIPSFKDATRLQEHCDKTCSPLYRAPELYDVDTDSIVTDKTDIWSLGCILYFMVYGFSPFERAANEPGSSIKLAVVNGRIQFQDESHSNRKYNEDYLRLIKSMLERDSTQRPDISSVIHSIEGRSSEGERKHEEEREGSWKASFD